jgi:hypothetical protein
LILKLKGRYNGREDKKNISVLGQFVVELIEGQGGDYEGSSEGNKERKKETRAF